MEATAYLNMKTHDKYDKHELIKFYTLVEGRVIRLMGGIIQADAYLTEHDAFTALWDFTATKYKDGWGYETVADVWHALLPKTAAETPLRWAHYKRTPYKRKYSYPSIKSTAKAAWKRLPILT